MGLTPGDRVAILAENCPQWVIVDLAVLGMGGVVVPLYPTSSADEIAHVLSDSATRAIAVRGNEKLKKFAQLAVGLAGLDADHRRPQRLAAPAGGRRGRFDASLENLSGPAGSRAYGSQPLRRRDHNIHLGHDRRLQGRGPDPRQHSGQCEASQAALDSNDRDMTLSFLPVAHSFERTAGYYTVMTAGGTIAYAEGLGQIAQNLLEVNPTDCAHRAAAAGSDP